MIQSDIVSYVGEMGDVPDALRITPLKDRKSSVYLTKYEVARIIGERARQIVNGTSVLLDSQNGCGTGNSLELAEGCADPFAASVDPIHITKLELLQGRIPMIVRRTWPDGRTENIPVNELKVDKMLLDVQH
ncbi:DNA-directed RNA polymerase I subunit, putative [Trypanosoma equiperdum]|uniref:DNA-directed RNA polymerase I subunit, putative n=1 Tax=Trypanosoma equiperdum TaxID=5694 RepID=A0A1G4I759_TRYEQ|nr:DNA-directed RNA polymerase I subunit, putative [Trypanosoma equiperdum]